jgi:hypothetical protein
MYTELDKAKTGVLVGVIDLPSNTRMALKLVLLSANIEAIQMAIYTSEGEILIIKITEFGFTSAGYSFIVASIDKERIHGQSYREEMDLVMAVTGGICYFPLTSRNKHPINCKNLMDSDGKLIISIGNDGVVRIFDISSLSVSKSILAGNDNVGRYAMHALMVRGPYYEEIVEEYVEDDTSDGNGSERSGSNRSNGLNVDSDDEDENLFPRNNTIQSENNGKIEINQNDIASKKSNYANRTIRSRAFVKERKLAPTNALTSGHIFVLSGDSPRAQAENERKLRIFYDKNKLFPSKYRGLVWKFIMRLPNNKKEFDAICSREEHQSVKLFSKQFQSLQPKSLFHSLQNTCSRLAHWSPVLGKASYLPQLVFPLIHIFGEDEIAIFEASMLFLLFWGNSWHIAYPHAPEHIIESLSKILQQHDSRLYFHLINLGIVPGEVAWNLLSTIFTEFLSKSNWLKLMDFMIMSALPSVGSPSTLSKRSGYILFAPIALMRCSRASIFSVDRTDITITTYFRRQQGVNIDEVISEMKSMMESTTPSLLSCLIQSKVNDNDEDTGKSKQPFVFPMSSTGRYPVYDNYPKFVLNSDLKSEEQEIELKSEITRKHVIISGLQDKVEEIRNDHQRWMYKHSSSVEVESQHRKLVDEKEMKRLEALQEVEEQISKQRVATLEELENASQEEIVMLQKLSEQSKKDLINKDKFMSEKMVLLKNVQKHRLLATKMETSAIERLDKLKLRRMKVELQRGITATIKFQEDDIDNKDRLFMEKCNEEDDRVQNEFDIRLKKIKNLANDRDSLHLNSVMKRKLNSIQIASDIKEEEIKSTRKLRQLQEESTKEEEERLYKILSQKNELPNLMDIKDVLDDEGKGILSFQKKILTTADEVKEESQKLLIAEAIYKKNLQVSIKEKNHALLKKDWKDQLNNQLSDVLHVEGNVREQMVRLKRASLVEEEKLKKIESVASEKVLNETMKSIEKIGQDVMTKQKERFDGMKQALTEVISERVSYNNLTTEKIVKTNLNEEDTKNHIVKKSIKKKLDVHEENLIIKNHPKEKYVIEKVEPKQELQVKDQNIIHTNDEIYINNQDLNQFLEDNESCDKESQSSGSEQMNPVVDNLIKRASEILIESNIKPSFTVKDDDKEIDNLMSTLLSTSDVVSEDSLNSSNIIEKKIKSIIINELKFQNEDESIDGIDSSITSTISMHTASEQDEPSTTSTIDQIRSDDNEVENNNNNNNEIVVSSSINDNMISSDNSDALVIDNNNGVIADITEELSEYSEGYTGLYASAIDGMGLNLRDHSTISSTINNNIEDGYDGVDILIGNDSGESGGNSSLDTPDMDDSAIWGLAGDLDDSGYE